jgi:PAS domain S-box-containing protein
MLASWRSGRALPLGLATALVALAYVLSGRAGLLLAIPPGYATAIFPPAGVALAALLMGGYRLVPAIWLGSLLMNLWVSWETRGQLSLMLWLVSAGIALGATLQAAVGLALVRRAAHARPRLQELGEILRVLLVGGPMACLISASIGTTMLFSIGAVTVNQWATSWLVWWVGDALGVLVVLPLSLAACNWPAQAWDGRRNIVVWPLLVCLLGTVLIYLRVSHAEQQRIQTFFLAQAERAARMVEGNLIRYLQSAQATRSFMEVADRERPEVFRHFVSEERTRLPGLGFVVWAPRVTRAQVADYEAQLRSWFGAQHMLHEWGIDGMRPVSSREEYYPATFIEPFPAVPQARGTDLLSEPARRRATLSAIERQDLALTERVHLMHERDGSWTSMAVLPVRALSGETLGMVIVALRLEDIIPQSTDLTQTPELRFTIWDITQPAGPQLLHGKPNSQSWTREETFSVKMTLGDRVWEIRAHITPELASPTRSWQTWALLATCLLFSGLLAILLLDQTGQKARVGALVAERTQTLRQREQFLSTVLQSALDGLLTLNASGRVRSANPAAGRLLGLTIQEWEGMPLSEVLPSLNWPTLRAELDQLPAESPGIVRQARARRRDGTEVEVELALSNASIDGAQSYVCLLHDLTERMRITRMKDEFVSTVSHELRTPLTSVIGSLALIRSGKMEPAVIDKLLGMADSNAQRLLQLINDLLDVDKMEAGKFSLECKPLPVLPLLVRSKEENGGYAARFQVSLSLRLEGAEGAIADVDEGRFAQVMNNLLSNAIKFSPPGSTVDMGLRLEQDWLELFVQDHGAGIPAEFQPLLFRKFSQADSSDTRRQRGTGLGLYLTRMLVECMKGDIRYETAQGQGTTFFVRLPRFKAA